MGDDVEYICVKFWMCSKPIYVNRLFLIQHTSHLPRSDYVLSSRARLPVTACSSVSVPLCPL